MEGPRLIHYVIVAAVLYLFWLLLSGHYSPLLLVLGAVSVALSTLVLAAMDRLDGERHTPPRPRAALWSYWGWLALKMVQSNIRVARRIWDPRLPIDPSWRRLPMNLDTPMKRTLYANSITLTPGTLTTDIDETWIEVHALSAEDMQEVLDGAMEARVRAMTLGRDGAQD